MKDLSAIGDRVTLSLKVKGQLINNLIIAKGYLSNTGAVPIVPSEYHENLSINVKSPWRIISVENSPDLRPAVELRWRRISDTKYEADPALLNPGDKTSTNIYLTNTRFSEAVITETEPRAEIEWKARITNLRAIIEPPSIIDRLMKGSRFGIIVQLSGWSLPFMSIAFLLFQALYLHLLSRAGLSRDWTWRTIVLILGTSLLSLTAAESIVTYLFNMPYNELFGLGVDHWLNAPWIILHAAATITLYWKARLFGQDRPVLHTD